jgi:hypothetical protein
MARLHSLELALHYKEDALQDGWHLIEGVCVVVSITTISCNVSIGISTDDAPKDGMTAIGKECAS